MIETKGLTHIHLFVADVERSKRFYETVFGFKELFREGPKMVFLQPPGTADLITLNEVPGRVGKPGPIEHFGFRLVDKKDLARAIDEVIKAGGQLLERGEHEPGRPFAYVADPDGHMIEL